MAWLRDPVWQKGVAILLVTAGAALIYQGTTVVDALGGSALLGVALLGLGVALPLVSQTLHARRENAAGSEDA